KTAMTADAIGRLSARPPALTGLSRKSPTSEGGGSDNRRPVKKGPELRGANLRGDQRDEQAEEQRRSGQIAPIERHRHGIAAGFAERRRGDLDDPEPEGDGRYLAHRRMAVHDQTLCV